MIPYSDRAEIVRSIKYVDAVVPQYDMDKLTACKKLGASILFVGDDWYGTDKWKKYEEEFAKEVSVIKDAMEMLDENTAEKEIRNLLTTKMSEDKRNLLLKAKEQIQNFDYEEALEQLEMLSV